MTRFATMVNFFLVMLRKSPCNDDVGNEDIGLEIMNDVEIEDIGLEIMNLYGNKFGKKLIMLWMKFCQ